MSGDLSTEDGVERPGPGLAPTAFRIWRAGKNMTDKGPVYVTPDAIEAVLESQAARGNRYSIDLNHGSLDLKAHPAAQVAIGYHRLEKRESDTGPELWACDSEWGDFARAQLESKPPGLRYFSPAYDLVTDPESPRYRELVRYLNLALTPNPATWNTTALATANAERTMEEEEKTNPGLDMSAIVAQLHKAATETKDEEERAKLLKMIKLAEPPALGGGEGQGEGAVKAADEKVEPKAADKPIAEEKKDSIKTASVKASADPAVAVLAATVQRLVERDEAREKAAISTERASLAGRKGLAPELASIVRDPATPIVTARSIAAAAKPPPVALKDLTTETVAASRGLGVGEGERGIAQLPAEQASVLEQQMGMRPATAPRPHIDGMGRFVVPTETPTQARARIAADAKKAQVSQ